ncbi:MAG: hypothetical protein RQ750_17070 [Roseovarius sp.]|nr:hypothetical protein [Roseovarius sp.]
MPRTPQQKTAYNSLKAGLAEGLVDAQNVDRAVADVARAHMMSRWDSLVVVERVWRDEFSIMGPN